MHTKNNINVSKYFSTLLCNGYSLYPRFFYYHHLPIPWAKPSAKTSDIHIKLYDYNDEFQTPPANYGRQIERNTHMYSSLPRSSVLSSEARVAFGKNNMVVARGRGHSVPNLGLTAYSCSRVYYQSKFNLIIIPVKTLLLISLNLILMSCHPNMILISTKIKQLLPWILYSKYPSSDRLLF